MRRPCVPLWYRALVGAWGLWFAVVLTAPAVLPPCPAHGGHGAHATAAPMHHMHHGAAPAQRGQHESTACTCLGQCCCAGPVAVPTTWRGVIARVVRRDAAAPCGDVQAPRTQWAYAHPFATAPPEA